MIDALAPKPGGCYLDGTLGGGGHSAALLEASGPDGIVVGIDRDATAIAAATERLAAFGSRLVAVHGTFAQMADLGSAWAPYDGILLDLGASSPQLDRPERGFSFQHDGPVDMRMDTTRGECASALLDRVEEDGLVEILRRFGEEPRARRIARAIIAGRPWTSTVALAGCVAESSGYRQGRTHPATRTFQALRIAVNDELGQLRAALDAAIALVRTGGHIAVISFHSLEDRIVKQHFRAAAGIAQPRDAYGRPIVPPVGRLIHRRGIAGKHAEADHPRSRSARLRVLEITGPIVTKPLSP